MIFEDVDIMDLYPYLVGLAAAIIGMVLIYALYYKPRIEKPLPNERGLGLWSIWLPKGFGLLTGFTCTAQKTLENLLTKVIENEEAARRTKLEKTRGYLSKFHAIAQKVGRTTYILLFDANPLDQKYMDSDPDRNDAYIVHGVQDVFSAGEWNRMKFLGIKLNPDTKMFSEAELKEVESVLEASKYLRDAARNTEKMTEMKREIDDKNTQLKKTLDDLAKTRSVLDRCMNALSLKPLTTPPEVKVSGTLRQRIKQWFTWPQVLAAAIAYLVTPNILSYFNLNIGPPLISIVVLLATIFGFFFIPLIRKIGGRIF